MEAGQKGQEPWLRMMINVLRYVHGGHKRSLCKARASHFIVVVVVLGQEVVGHCPHESRGNSDPQNPFQTSRRQHSVTGPAVQSPAIHQTACCALAPRTANTLFYDLDPSPLAPQEEKNYNQATHQDKLHPIPETAMKVTLRVRCHLLNSVAFFKPHTEPLLAYICPQEIVEMCFVMWMMMHLVCPKLRHNRVWLCMALH